MTLKQKYIAAVVQNMPLYNTEKSITSALQMVSEAAVAADIVLLPEMFSTPYELALMDKAADFSDSALDELCRIAKQHDTFICSGSLPLRRSTKLTNTSFLIDNSGGLILEYDKCHLFDVQLPQLTVSESKVFTAGNSVKTVETILGRIGISICYDIRFPELTRKLTLQGMQLLCVPAAFSETTGKAHWHTVMRARAIENQIYICVASPARNDESSYPAYGHSMIISPWGEIIAEAGCVQEIIYGEIDPATIDKIRRQLPLLKHRRPQLY
jgi:predicted amidohydrolase